MHKLLLRLPRPLRPRTCLDCGFFAFRERAPEEDDPAPPVYEALAWVRRTIQSQAVRFGQRIERKDWFEKEAPAFCFKHLWNPPEDAAINIQIIEAALVSRRSCRSFHPWQPGRTPEQHLQLEDERRAHRRQVWLALVPAVIAFFGALFGALLPALVGWLRRGLP